MRPIINVVGLLLILALVLISFPKELGKIPAQEIARWTRYPAWHPEIIGLYKFNFQAFHILNNFLSLDII